MGGRRIKSRGTYFREIKAAWRNGLMVDNGECKLRFNVFYLLLVAFWSYQLDFITFSNALLIPFSFFKPSSCISA